MEKNLFKDFAEMMDTKQEIIKQRSEGKNRAIQTWNYVFENEPIVRKNPVVVDFNLNIKFSAACKASDIKDIKKYLVEGVDINYVGPDGLTALHNAIIDNNCDVVKLLVENGADVNIQDPMYWTPLHSAIEMGNLEIIKILLDNGADPSLVNSDEKLPIDLAKNLEITNVIRKKMDELCLDIGDLRKRERLLIKRDIQRWYDKKNWDEKCHPLSGCYAIHVCAAKNYIPELYELLIYIRCDPNIKDNDGWTPLHGAVYWNNADAAILLARNGADVYARTNANENIVDICETEESRKLASDIMNKNKELDDYVIEQEFGDFVMPERIETVPRLADIRFTPDPVEKNPSAPKPTATNDIKTPIVKANNENAGKFTTGVPWEKVNKLKKVENSVKLFNAINTNNSIVATPNQKVTHDESESERKMISKQRRSARRSTRGITKDELDEVMSVAQKVDGLSFASPKNSSEDSLNKLPSVNSRTKISKHSDFNNRDKIKKSQTVSCKADIGTTFTENIETSDGSLSVNNSFLDTNLQEDLGKLSKSEDGNLLSKKPISCPQSFSTSTKIYPAKIDYMVTPRIAKKTFTEINDVKSKDMSNKEKSQKTIEVQEHECDDGKHHKVDKEVLDYELLYHAEKEAHEKLKKSFFQCQKDSDAHRDKFEKIEKELERTRNELDELRRLKIENNALVRVLGKIAKDDTPRRT